MRKFQDKFLERVKAMAENHECEAVIEKRANNAGYIYIHKDSESFETLLTIVFTIQPDTFSVNVKDSQGRIYKDFFAGLSAGAYIEKMFTYINASLPGEGLE